MAEQKIQRHELYDDGLEQHPQGTWVRYQDVEPILLAADAMEKAADEVGGVEIVFEGGRKLAVTPEYIDDLKSAVDAYRKAVSQ